MSLTDEQLAEIRDRAQQAESIALGPNALLRALASARDVPALLAALEQACVDRDERLTLAESSRLAKIIDELSEELRATRNARLIAAVLGCHKGAPKPFAVHARKVGVVAVGCEFDDGVVVVRQVEEPSHVVVCDSMEAIPDWGHLTQVVWLSDELEPLAEVEQERDRLRAEREQFERLAHGDVWVHRDQIGEILNGDTLKPDDCSRCGGLDGTHTVRNCGELEVVERIDGEVG